MSENNLPIGYKKPDYDQEQAIRRAKIKGFRWPKGQSGNPTGHSKLYYECRKIAQQASPEAMRQLIELAKTAEDERVRSVCLIAILDRAGISPIQGAEILEQIKGQEEREKKFDFSGYSPSQLAELEAAVKTIIRIRDEQKAALANPPP